MGNIKLVNYILKNNELDNYLVYEFSQRVLRSATGVAVCNESPQ